MQVRWLLSGGRAVRPAVLGLGLALAACGGGGGSSSTSTGGGADTEPGNSAPVVTLANLDQAGETGVAFEYDATQNGTTFTDPDGDALSYAVSLTPANTGLDVQAGRVTGIPDRAVTVTAVITASDPSGASASDTFQIIITDNQDVVAQSGPAGLRFRVGQAVNVDLQDWEAYFTDPSGTGVTLSLDLASEVPGLTRQGTRLSGRPTTAGVLCGDRVREQWNRGARRARYSYRRGSRDDHRGAGSACHGV